MTEGPVAVLNAAAEWRDRDGEEPRPVVRVLPGRLGLVGTSASSVLPVGTEYMKVFHTVALMAAFLAYAAGQLPAAIWMGKPWSIAAKEVLDGLIYGLVTAGTFGWLWPR